MTDGGYIVPNPTQGYDMNPVDVYNANPQGHGVNPVERYNGNPILADEDMENPLDFAIPSPNGFGGVDNDILDTLGLGSQGFEGWFLICKFVDSVQFPFSLLDWMIVMML
ncbi:hypothetical protein V6N13_016793 [Hibiscus sabdariffa]